MTTATQAVREHSVHTVHCDIPADLTIAEYRDRRRRRPKRRRRNPLAGLLRR